MAVDNDVIADPDMLTEFMLQGLLKR